MNKALRRACCVLGLLSAAPVACAYELATHGALTWHAYQRSVLVTDARRLRDLGIDVASLNPFGGVYYDVFGVQIRERSENAFERRIIEEDLRSIGANAMSIPGWLMRGAIREDDLGFAFGQALGDDPHDDPYGPIWRVMHHFYDPARNLPLTLSQSSAFIFQQASGESADFRKAPDWAIGSRDAFGQPNAAEANRRNHFTIFDAREAMYRALTGRDSLGNPLQPVLGGMLNKQSDIRNAYWATAFRALGNVLHLNQEMAQPQHTRNDVHAGVPPFGHQSIVEKYIDARATGAPSYQVDGTQLTPQPLNYGGYPIPDFTKYNDFWSTREAISGRGLADYSNRGFFSFGTNLGSNLYASPSNNAASYTKESAVGLLPTELLQKFSFLRGDVPDTLNAGSSANIRMTTESVFDLFLLTTPPTYSLNRFNYDDMANLLIPRAVAYSAGLINYFFRGRLDAEPQGIGALLAKNLSAEAMQGDFGLYYDDAQGNRHPVTVTACRVGAVDVPVDQGKCKAAALASVNISPNSRLEVSFTPPADPAPKSAGEYMLVFNGTLGEEKAEEGTVGAVVAKQIRAFSGTLYISALDNLGRRVSLKADASGTRVIQPGEFDPLLFVTPFNPGPAKAYSMKQVVFTQTGPGQYSYEPLALTLGNTLFGSLTTTGLVKNSSTNTFEVTDGGSWLAKSPQPEIGEFTFRVVPDASGTNGSLQYTRRYRGADGTPATQTGSVALPTLVGSFEINYTSLASGGLFVSGDGLTVSGLREFQNVASGFEIAHYDLMIGLDITPTISLVERRREPFFSQTNVNQPFTQRIVGTVSTTPQCQEGAKPVQFNLIADSFRKEFRANQNEIRPIEYLNNNLASYRLTRVSTHLASGEREGGGVRVGEIFGPCSAVGGWVYSQTKGTVIERFVEERQAIFSDGVLMGTVGSTTTFFHDELQGHFGLSNRAWDYLYEGVGNAQPPIQFTSLPGPSINNLRYTIVHALTDRVDDAIYTLSISGGPARTRFRSLDITGQSYVADASPVGEVFFATADLSVVVHEPKGSAPKVVFPPNIVRLLSAVWL